MSPEMGRMGAEDPSTLPQHPAELMNERLWAALSEIQDPEMPVNLVDLGVIYGVEERDGIVDVDLTFTAMGCPASEFILDDVRERLMREPGVKEVRIQVVWDPPWTVARMTQAGRDSLEAWGVAI
jgi:metal-sulfur cluster biosynthetic enzyme